jgi:hypothetical protein
VFVGQLNALKLGVQPCVGHFGSSRNPTIVGQGWHVANHNKPKLQINVVKASTTIACAILAHFPFQIQQWNHHSIIHQILATQLLRVGIMAYMFDKRKFFNKVINICPIISITSIWMLIR